ncbi:MAG: alpha/beta hydrolase [Bacteroidota bacterium]
MASPQHALMKRLELKDFPQPEIVRLKYPIVLCHGFGGIGSLLKPSALHDACMLMREYGIMAFAPNVIPYARIATRAEYWRKLIFMLKEEYGFDKFNIIGHSMGGLDIRYAITHLGLHEEVASLTTIATPHHGTFLANLVLKGPDLITEKLSEVLDWFGESVHPSGKSEVLSSVEQLTLEYVQEEFNPSTPNHPDIPYFSYGAAVGKGTSFSLNPIFLFQNAQIYGKEGVNDSFVSAKSAEWGTFLGNVSLSHMNQINMRVTREFKPIYQSFWKELIDYLYNHGF